MGLVHAKFDRKSKAMMLDKKMFTSNMSLQSTLVLNAMDRQLLASKSALKNSNGEKLSSYLLDKMMTGLDIAKLYTEIPVETITTEPLPEVISEKNVNQSASTVISKPNYQKNHVERLGLHEIHSYDEAPCFRGVIYLPEGDIVLAHYLTLYRLKMDILSQVDFQDWCLTIGHVNTACDYSRLKAVYNDWKVKHFKEGFIINRILSKQSVHLRISDRFGNAIKPLRALIFIGRRRQLVQNVMESYYFDVQGKVPFIIKSIDEYRKQMQFCDKNKMEHLWPEDADMSSFKNMSNPSRMKMSGEHPRIPLTTNERLLDVFEDSKMNSFMFLKSDRTEFFHNDRSRSEIVYEPFSNYMRRQRCNPENTSISYNTPISFGDATYNLVSVIADPKYAYILCKNTLFNFNECNKVEYKSLMSDEPSTPKNQSNSFSRFKTLRRIMKTEIFETFAQKYYGVSLNQVPCGQFYVVQCTIDGRISERESLINKILVRHMVCGKIINKEYNLEVYGCGDINFILHLHGNERHVRKCCNDLKGEGLAHFFKLVHPRSGRLLQEKVRTGHLVLPNYSMPFPTDLQGTVL